VEKGQFKPSGVYVAMVTPIDDGGNIIEDELRRVTDWLIKQGVDGLFPLGSTGEYIHFSQKEKIKILELIIQETGKRIPVVPGATESCSDNCTEMVNIVRDLGCSAAVISPPYYFPSSQEMLISHYEAVIEAVPNFPIVLYNIPFYSTQLDYQTVEKLSRYESIVAIKDSSGSMVDFLNYINRVEKAGGELNFFTGREEMFFPALMVGADGCMTATAGLVPEIVIEIYKYYNQQDYTKSLELQLSLLALIRTMLEAPFPLGFKIALECRGFNVGSLKKRLSNHEKDRYDNLKRQIYDLLKQLLGDSMLVDK
jgi:4-hydroxy-tetrahydrodipicolinate synthase